MSIKANYCLLSIGLVVFSFQAWNRSSSQAQEGGGLFNPIIGAFDQSNLAPVPTVHLATTVRSAQEARTWLKHHSASLVFQKETSLGDLIKAIRTATKGKESDAPAIPIYLDPLGLQMAEKTLDSPIAWDVEGLPLSTSLPLILKQVGLRFNVMPSGLLLISAETNQDVPSDPSALILDNLSMLRDEVATLRAEVFALRRCGKDNPQPQAVRVTVPSPSKTPKNKGRQEHSEISKPRP